MKTKTLVRLLAAMGLLSTLNPQPSTCLAAPPGTAFTYQGQLTDGGNPASGIFDFRFAIYDAAESGGQVGTNLTNSPVGVTNGLFTTTLDFGSGVFAGEARWLEIGVRTNGSAGDFTLLAPRQALTPTPYALYAISADVARTAVVASNASPGSIGTAALAVGAVDSSRIADGAVASNDLSGTVLSNTFWRVQGNKGTTPGGQFVGTTDNQPLEIRVNNQRALRIEPNASGAPNVIAGHAGNFVAGGVFGATIGGGGSASYTNVIGSTQATIAGGTGNSIGTSASCATIGGGHLNTVVNAFYTTIDGGYVNTIQTNSIYATIGGGSSNTIEPGNTSATVAGGQDNTIRRDAYWATIGGGDLNTIKADASGATIGGGYNNTIETNADYAFIGGGSLNTNSGAFATVAGGHQNSATNYAFAAGRRAKANHKGAFVWADGTDADFFSTSNNQFLIRAAGGVGIGTASPQSALHVAGTVTADVFSGSGSGLTGISGAALADGSVGNAKLANSAITVTAGTGLSGGGPVALGGSTTLNNAGVLSIVGNSDITATPATGNVILGTTASSANTPSTLVKRDAGGSFSAGSITLAGTLNLPSTTAGAGIIYQSGVTLMHTYGPSGSFFAGPGAGSLTMGGSGGNTGLGAGALAYNTSGSHNTAVGSWALRANTTGEGNTACGERALYLNTDGDNNTANGNGALYFNTNGFGNTANGYQALYFNRSGARNTASGWSALFSNTTGEGNTAFGTSTLTANTTGSGNTAVGNGALYSNLATNNTAVGAGALGNNTLGEQNTAVGGGALASNTNGHWNTAVGYQALILNQNGTANTATGYRALHLNTTGGGNTALGYWALGVNNGSDNSASGHFALYANTTGRANTAVGSRSLDSNTNGNFNTALGYNTLAGNTSGSSNIAIGYQAGSQPTTGDNNIHIGHPGAAGESCTIRIGTTNAAGNNVQTNTYIAGIWASVPPGTTARVIVNTAGKLGIETSSARFKEAMEDMGDQSEAILSLHPVSFRYKPEIDPEGVPQFGLVAEEVEQVAPGLVVRDSTGAPLTVRYEQVNAMLLNEFLKQHRRVRELEARLERLEQTLTHKLNRGAK